jgi:hypothetical protein
VRGRLTSGGGLKISSRPFSWRMTDWQECPVNKKKINKFVKMSQKFVNKIKLKTTQRNENIIINQQGDQKIKLSIKTSNIHDL